MVVEAKLAGAVGNVPACSRIAAKVGPACRIFGAALLQTGTSSQRRRSTWRFEIESPVLFSNGTIRSVVT